jgi:hypothetical protein
LAVVIILSFGFPRGEDPGEAVDHEDGGVGAGTESAEDYGRTANKMIKLLQKRRFLISVEALKDRMDKHRRQNPPTIDRTVKIESITRLFDHDDNGADGLEIFAFLSELGESLNVIYQGLRDTRKLVRSFDYIISTLLVIAAAFVYAAFFVNDLFEKTSSFWTLFGGLAFAFAGPVGDLSTSCAFVFAKQPYDVGDRVRYQKMDLIVKNIALYHTTFERIDNGNVTHVPNSEAAKETIENLSRTAERKEARLIATDMKFSDAEIKAIQDSLSRFASQPPGLDEDCNLVPSISRYFRPAIRRAGQTDNSDKDGIELVLHHTPRVVKASEGVLAKFRSRLDTELREEMKRTLKRREAPSEEVKASRPPSERLSKGDIEETSDAKSA